MSAAATQPNSPRTSSKKASRSSRWPSERLSRLYDCPLLGPPGKRGEESSRRRGSMTMADLIIRPFEVHVPDEDLADLQRRIAATRWPHKETVADRSQGVQLATLRYLVTYWGS